MASAETAPPPPPSGGEPTAPPQEEDKPSNPNFECNICLDTAKDAVISVCGHLFCWPCLHQWLEVRAHNKTCPVCKSAISRDKVIPLYGRGSDSSTDPRDKAPPRPPGQRSEPSPQNTFMHNLGFEGATTGLQFTTFAAGFFPFGGIFTLNTNGNATVPEGQLAEDRFLSSVMMLMGVLFVLWILLV